MIYIEMMIACNLDGMLKDFPSLKNRGKGKRFRTNAIRNGLNDLNGLNVLNS